MVKQIKSEDGVMYRGPFEDHVPPGAKPWKITALLPSKRKKNTDNGQSGGFSWQTSARFTTEAEAEQALAALEEKQNTASLRLKVLTKVHASGDFLHYVYDSSICIHGCSLKKMCFYCTRLMNDGSLEIDSAVKDIFKL